MTSPSQTSGGIETNSRGIAVIVVAVVVGFLLLLNAGGGAGASSDGGDTATPPVDTSELGDDTSTTSEPDDLVTTTDTSEPEDEARSPSEVTVAVLNGGGPTGSAGATSDVIAGAGWNKGTVDNANSNVESTRIYYAEGYQPEANAVASLLGKSSDAVEAMPEEPLGPVADSDNVVVVIGADTPPVGETTTTAAG